MKPTLNVYDASQTRDLSKLEPAKGSTMSADIELLPCPFCGAAATLSEDRKHAICLSCKTTTWIFVDAWNRRATPQAPTPAAAEGQAEALEIALDPRRWTREMHLAWHVNLPDTVQAFAALRAAAAPLPRQAAVQGEAQHALSAKHESVMRLAAKAIHNRGHEGDARLADSLLGVLAHLNSAAPTVKAGQSDTHLNSATARNEKV